MRAVVTAGLALLLLAAPAAGEAPYPPPSEGQGSAQPARVKQGHCTDFSGEGFAVDADIRLTDDSRFAGSTQADKQGRFRSRICFANDARVGQHVLRGSGAAAAPGPQQPAQHRVTAVVTVTGVEQSGGSGGGGHERGKGNDAAADDVQPAAVVRDLAVTPFGIALLLLLLTPLVSGVLLVRDRRHRRRRTA